MSDFDNDGIEPDKPALARVYDYVLGGGRNFAVDRELAHRVLAIIPGYRDFARENRAFLRRATLHMLAAGVEQFLDLGSGMLSVGPVHEIVHAANPASRVVYVDEDPIVTASVRLGVENDPRVGVVDADLCSVDQVLDHDATRQVLDLDRPVGLLAVAVLHCLSDAEEPAQVLRRYHDRLVPGSVLVASHASGDSLGAKLTHEGMERFATAGITVVSRSRSEFADLLGPWRPTPDGVVPIHWWRPDGSAAPAGDASLGYAVMASRVDAPDPGVDR